MAARAAFDESEETAMGLKKRYAAILLTAALAVSMSACGAAEDSSSGQSASQTDAAAEKNMARTEAIIYSMTPKEREHPEIINGSRRMRIAKGSGTTVQEVNRLLKQFDESKKMMKMLSGGNKLMRRMPGMRR